MIPFLFSPLFISHPSFMLGRCTIPPLFWAISFCNWVHWVWSGPLPFSFPRLPSLLSNFKAKNIGVPFWVILELSIGPALEKKQWKNHCGAWETHWTALQGSEASERTWSSLWGARISLFLHTVQYSESLSLQFHCFSKYSQFLPVNAYSHL